MSEPLLSPTLADALRGLWIERGLAPIDPEPLASALLKKGIGLVDASRTTFLIDVRVYEGVCFRLQRERRIRPPHRTIDASTWRGLTP